MKAITLRSPRSHGFTDTLTLLFASTALIIYRLYSKLRTPKQKTKSNPNEFNYTLF
jgi:hypothetical protein